MDYGLQKWLSGHVLQIKKLIQSPRQNILLESSFIYWAFFQCLVFSFWLLFFHLHLQPICSAVSFGWLFRTSSSCANPSAHPCHFSLQTDTVSQVVMKISLHFLLKLLSFPLWSNGWSACGQLHSPWSHLAHSSLSCWLHCFYQGSIGWGQERSYLTGT